MKKYCSSCGAEVKAGLSYCNRCGEKLGETKGEGTIADYLMRPAGTSLDSLIWAIVAVFVLGMGTNIGLMAVMKEVLHFNDGLIILFALLGFLLMCGIEGVLVSLLPRRRNKEREASGSTPVSELHRAQPPVLPQPVDSVTEHTTRSLEPSHRDRQTG